MRLFILPPRLHFLTCIPYLTLFSLALYSVILFTLSLTLFITFCTLVICSGVFNYWPFFWFAYYSRQFFIYLWSRFISAEYIFFLLTCLLQCLYSTGFICVYIGIFLVDKLVMVSPPHPWFVCVYVCVCIYVCVDVCAHALTFFQKNLWQVILKARD